jgi:hypothetical protein
MAVSGSKCNKVMMPPLVNTGIGEDVTIKGLAETIRSVVGHAGEIVLIRPSRMGHRGN